MKLLLIGLLAPLVLMFSAPAQASDFHIFIAAEPNYSNIGAAKIGFDDFEIGKMTRDSVGMNKLFRFNNSYYTSLGVVLRFGNALGLVAMVGFDYKMVAGLRFRGELYSIADHKGHASGAGNLGLAWHF